MFSFSHIEQYLHFSRNPLIQRNLTVTSRLSRKHFTSLNFFIPSVYKINLILKTCISFQTQFLCTKSLCGKQGLGFLHSLHTCLIYWAFLSYTLQSQTKGCYCSSVVEGQEKKNFEENQDNGILDLNFFASLIFLLFKYIVILVLIILFNMTCHRDVCSVSSPFKFPRTKP